MTLWIRQVSYIQHRHSLILPAKWCRKELGPGLEYVYIEELEDGVLKLYSEKEWFRERVSRNTIK